jgi:hypothetical protein
VSQESGVVAATRSRLTALPLLRGNVETPHIRDIVRGIFISERHHCEAKFQSCLLTLNDNANTPFLRKSPLSTFSNVQPDSPPPLQRGNTGSPHTGEVLKGDFIQKGML